MEFNKEYYRKYWQKRKVEIILKLGGVCWDCGGDDELEIDHIDPTKKTMNLSSRIASRSEAVLKELENCQLLCRECHKKKSIQARTPFTHGTYYGAAKKGCGCAECLLEV